MDKGRITAQFTPDAQYTRHSEGAFIRLKDGSILFVYSRFVASASDNAPSDLVGCVSFDEGETWSEPQVFMKAEDFGTENIMSVSLLRMNNGDLGVVCIAKELPRAYRIYLSRSADEGRTFYKRVDCLENVGQGLYVVNNARVVRLSTGRLILPLAFHRGDVLAEAGDDGRMDSHGVGVWVFSDDDGDSWQASGDLVYSPFTGNGAGLQEPGLIEKKNGALWGWYRTDLMAQYETFSLDGGKHWTSAQPSRFTAPCSPLTMARHESGRLYAVWNPIPNYFGRDIERGTMGRTPLVLSFSDDDGMTWSRPLTLEDAPDHGYCYVALFFTQDNALLASYCSGGPEQTVCLAQTTVRKIVL